MGQDWGEDLLQKRKYDKYLEFMNQNRNRFNPEPGPWNEFNPSDLPYPLYPGFDDEVTSEDLLQANLGNYDLFHLMRNGYSLEEAQQILNEQGLV